MAITPVVGAGYIVAVNDLAAQIDAGGATVPQATTTTFGTVKQAAIQADFAGADITALKVELNAFLTKLEAAGIVAV